MRACLPTGVETKGGAGGEEQERWSTGGLRYRDTEPPLGSGDHLAAGALGAPRVRTERKREGEMLPSSDCASRTHTSEAGITLLQGKVSPRPHRGLSEPRNRKQLIPVEEAGRG